MMQEEQPGAAAHPDPALPDTASSIAATFPSRNATSKYDFVKVWLGENAVHRLIWRRICSRCIFSPLFNVFHVNIYYIRFSDLKIFASSSSQLMEK
jgi:hypothetical protein